MKLLSWYFPIQQQWNWKRALLWLKNAVDLKVVVVGKPKKNIPMGGANKFQPQKKITLIFLDATWKHAREMDNKNAAAGVWPDHLIRVQLTPSVVDADYFGETKTTKNTYDPKTDFVQRRFYIRAPPSPDHLSTAECLAWIASRVEGNPLIFESIMKVLDSMVELWRGFASCEKEHDKNDPRSNGARRHFSHGDGCISGKGWDAMSQKKRKIKANCMIDNKNGNS
mmetsp:Transcript_27292/g.55114  ORF Transcript_27292/g.55114 Transcript_27292/m.55114 type:complete len:225 (-) Transcript_27292:10-684(-)